MKKSLLFLLICISLSANSYSQVDNRIHYNNQDLWVNGGNIAWVNFGRDIGPGNTPLNDFESMFTQVRENGGNTMRFWTHIDGRSTPSWDGNEVTGPGDGTIEDLRTILDMAWENNVSLVLCLWSFDMLRTSSGTTITNRAKALLEDSTLTETYIQNSLIPMVEALGDHPAIQAWEIFNEPEGMSNEFGWGDIRHTAMANIQRFVNQTAGAIHRTNPNALVSNGAWSFSALATTSRSKSKNYYSDAELIAAGGDSLGTLDFYMVHYYESFGTDLSPFHHDKSTWNLDKPLVIGEFGVPSSSLYGIPKEDLYETLYNRGYAGALVWQWVDWAQDRGTYGPSWLRGLDQMSYMRDTYFEDVSIINYSPIVREFRASIPEVEAGGQTELHWVVFNAETVTLNGVSVDAEEGSQIETLTETTTFTLIATGAEGAKDSSTVTINVVPAGLINRALGKPSRASTFETCCGENRVSALAFDGDTTTRWSSAWSDGSGLTDEDPNTDENPEDEWIEVDLEKAHKVGSVLLNWEDAHSTEYSLQTSLDGQSWTTVYSDNNADGGIDSIAFSEPERARFVRMHGTAKTPTFGHSLWEFEVRGSVSVEQPPSIAIVSPSNYKAVPVGGDVEVKVEATDINGTIEYVSFFVNGDSVGVDATAPYAFTFADITEGEHIIYAKAKDDEGFIVQSYPVTVEGRTDIVVVRLEAEDATLTGATSIKLGESGASRGIAVSMEGSGRITWDNLTFPEAEEYDITIRYFLPFDYKEQELMVNGNIVDTLKFNLPVEEWQSLKTTISSEGPLTSIAIDHYWGYMRFDYIEITAQDIPIANEEDSFLPKDIVLQQNYPNPFNPTTNIVYTLPQTANVRLSVYNLLGQEVEQLVNGRQSAGSYTATWDASTMASGVYLYKLSVGGKDISKKMVLIK
tara:strand:- start:454 stop:3195 length:2742 start_codon:yes stop_codon:yes gene_type:complete